METPEVLYGDRVMVLWDVEDASILNSLDPELVYENIRSDIEDKKGFRRCWSMCAFVDDKTPETLIDIYTFAGIVPFLVPEGNKYERIQYKVLETLFWAEKGRGRRSNLMIILSKTIKEEKQFTSVVDAINAKGNFKIVFEDPTSLLAKCVGTPVDRSKEGTDRCSLCNSLLKKGESSSQNDQ